VTSLLAAFNEEIGMKQIHIESTGPMNYQAAIAIAMKQASYDGEMEEPVLVAWHDRLHAMMSPTIAGADIDTRWRDYGESHCGCLEVSVGEDFEFIFADGGPFAGYGDFGPDPYVNLSDAYGHQYLCRGRAESGTQFSEPEICWPLDDYTSKMT
jgi:hypothetical protein